MPRGAAGTRATRPFVVSAVVTPSIDPITQTLVAVPIVVLYFFGCFLAMLVEKNPIIPRT